MPYCNQCGGENAESARFCTHCGVAVSGSTVGATQTTNAPRRNAGGKVKAVLVVLVAVASVGFLFMFVAIPLFPQSGSATTCEELQGDIIELSEERDGQFSSSILKMYDVREVASTRYILECRADARWSRGGDDPVIFYLEEDDSGDRFIGYRRQ